MARYAAGFVEMARASELTLRRENGAVRVALETKREMAEIDLRWAMNGIKSAGYSDEPSDRE